MADRPRYRIAETVAAALLTAAAAAALGGAPSAFANETVNYGYDARGRLVQVSRSGTVNNNVVTNYAFDKADNRTSKTTTGSANPGPP
jgi:YD repeat-containing protein